MAEDLKSFKIGDTRTAGARAPVSRRGAEAAESAADVGSIAAQSVGFAAIEELVEKSTAAQASERLSRVMQALEEYQVQAGSKREEHQAAQSIAAVERVADLLDYLFATKDRLAAP